MIIETTDNRFYYVQEHTDPDLAHCWDGQAVKRVKGQWVVKNNGRWQLVSKAHLHRIIEEA